MIPGPWAWQLLSIVIRHTVNVCLTRSKTYKFWPLYFKIFYYVFRNKRTQVCWVNQQSVRIETNTRLHLHWTGFILPRKDERISKSGERGTWIGKHTFWRKCQWSYLRHNSSQRTSQIMIISVDEIEKGRSTVMKQFYKFLCPVVQQKVLNVM